MWDYFKLLSICIIKLTKNSSDKICLKKKEYRFGWVVKYGGTGRSWWRENHNLNVLYEKSFIFSFKNLKNRYED